MCSGCSISYIGWTPNEISCVTAAAAISVATTLARQTLSGVLKGENVCHDVDGGRRRKKEGRRKGESSRALSLLRRRLLLMLSRIFEIYSIDCLLRSYSFYSAFVLLAWDGFLGGRVPTYIFTKIGRLAARRKFNFLSI